MQGIHSNQPTSTGNASQYNETRKNNLEEKQNDFKTAKTHPRGSAEK